MHLKKQNCLKLTKHYDKWVHGLYIMAELANSLSREKPILPSNSLVEKNNFPGWRELIIPEEK